MTKYYNSFKTICRLAIVAFGLVPVAMYAASDGSPGSTSQGTMNVYINVGDEVRIAGLQDYTNPTWDGKSFTYETPKFCVYSNNPQGNQYAVTVTGSNTDFELASNVNGVDAVPYSVEYNDGHQGYEAVQPGVKLPGRIGSGIASPLCGGSNNASLKIHVENATGTQGTYQSTVNLLVSAT